MQTIAVLSDTHGELPPLLLERIGSVDAIIHAGDFADGEVFDRLERIAPVYGVRGNCDRGVVGGLPDKIVFERGGCRLAVVHRLQDLNLASLAGAVEGVICGHTHVQAAAEHRGLHVFNPGSPVHPRGGSPAGYGILTISEQGWKLEHKSLASE